MLRENMNKEVKNYHSLENVDRENADEVRDENEKKKFLRSLFLKYEKFSFS